MTKRISKILLPRPMSVAFARELALLMTGYDEGSAPGKFAITRILDTAWSEAEPVNLVSIYHNIQSGRQPDAGELRSRAKVGPESVSEFRKMLRTLTTLLGGLPNDPAELNIVKELVSQRWMQSIRAIAADHEPVSSQLLSLLATYGVFSAEPDGDLSDEALAEAMTSAAASGLPAHVGGRGGPRIMMLPPGANPLEYIQQMLGIREAQPRAATAQERLPAPAIDPSRPAMHVYRQADVVSLVQRMPATPMPGEGNAQQRRLLETMADNDGLRKLVEVPEGNPLNELYTRFPHFKEVLDAIQPALALAGCGDEGRPVSIPPILLRGEPGTGKTYFAQELARVLGLHFLERDMSVTSEAFVLAGMDSGWKNSKPGIVFDALVNGRTANPLILINEVDKAANKEAHNSPMAPLYSLLEPTSSSHFSDEFVPVSLDASRVIWVLTANDGPIPEPILSRLEVFDIRTPNEEECRVIAQSVWTSICERGMPKGHGFCAELGEPMLDVMGKMSPRVMRKALTRAAGNAALQGRKFLLLEDLESSKKRYETVKRQPIGFTR